MTHVKLMGELGEKFGTDWHMATSSFRDIFKLIDCQTEGFRDYIRESADKGIDFNIINGEDLLEDGYSVILEKPQDLVIITPTAAGAGGSDVLKVIVGAILFFYGYQYISKFDWARTAEVTTEVGGASTTTVGGKYAAKYIRKSSNLGSTISRCRTSNVGRNRIYDTRKSFRSRRQLSL